MVPLLRNFTKVLSGLQNDAVLEQLSRYTDTWYLLGQLIFATHKKNYGLKVMRKPWAFDTSWYIEGAKWFELHYMQ